MSPHRGAPGSADGGVALAHDFLNQHGGAERVALALSDIWPDAPIHTSLYRPDSTFPEFRGRDIRTSFLQHLPVDRRFRTLLPLFPLAFESMRVDAPIVISSSSAFAHGIQRPTDSFHAVYCHTPPRWLYRWDYLGPRSRAERAASPLRPAFRRWDQRAARRADLYIANGQVVQERIARVYGRYAPIVHPPVNIDRFHPCERGTRILVVSRLLPYKGVDVVVRAATAAGVGLDVVGTGPDLDRLRSLGGPSVEFHGTLPDDAVTELMEHCNALCVPGSEDFGLTLVEAQAAGKPVIALASGGALETVEDGVTGTLFAERSSDAVLRGLKQLERLDTSPQEIATHAERFSPAAFADRLCDVISTAVRRAEAEVRVEVAAANAFAS